ncbi:MAG: nuclear transport factor 2 family protein [Tepidisphaerales bacterium]
MRIHRYLALAAGLALSSGTHAQAPVVAADDAEALFHSSDPKLDANKQIAYHIVKEMLQAGHPEAADKYLSERYIQHNPNFPSGRDPIKKTFAMVKPKPIPEKMAPSVVSVVAEGDMVIVASVSKRPDPKQPGKTYTTTHFDMWRIKDGKADEHWDEAPLGPPEGPPPGR